jgi:acylphosphatase
MSCRKYIVHGKVQGVWFRESTRRLAVELGLAGHAVNLPDGTVEVIAKGKDAAMEQLAAWLLRGPPMAQVDRLEQSDCGAEVPPGFRTNKA